MRLSFAARRRVARVLALALIALGIAIVPATSAHASHFRFRDLTWRYDHALAGGAGNVVELTLRVADRRSYYGGSIGVGSPFQEQVTTGDGGYATLSGQVIAVNYVDDWFIAEIRGFHTYATAGPYSVSWTGCCTLSTLRNSRDSYLRTTTVINIANGNTASPLSLVSPIVNLAARAAVQTIRMPATDPDGGNVSFRLATQAESLVTQPPGLSIDSRTGVMSWDTTGRLNGLWMATVVLSDAGGASTMSTFLIKLGGTVSAPPEWFDPTYEDRSNFSVMPGGSLSFTLYAEDPDGDDVYITALNTPSGLICLDEPASLGAATLKCTWAPHTTGTHLIAFDAQDEYGASAGLLSYRLTAPRYVAMGDSYASGEGALDADNYQAGTDGDSGGNGCRRASTAYSHIVASDASTPFTEETLHFVACSGARTFHFESLAQYPDHYLPQERQFDMAELGQDVELVTVMIGGNDAGFGAILKDCMGAEELIPFNNCSGEPEKTENKVQDAFARLRGEPTEYGQGDERTRPLAEIYSRIRRESPRARVLVVGYPQFFRTGGTYFNECSNVTPADQRWVNDKVAEMNELLRNEAASLGLEFVATSDSFEGHRLCEIFNEEWFRDIQLDFDLQLMDPASFHPDDRGHRAVAADVLEVWNSPPPAIMMTTGESSESTIDVGTGQGWLSAVAGWPGSDVELTLTSPSGKVYHRSAVPSDAQHLLGPTYEIFRVPRPEVGRWRIRLFGADLGADGEPVTLSTNITPVWNKPPVADAKFQLTGRTLHLDGSGSADPEGGALVKYEWAITDADGMVQVLSGQNAVHTFTRTGDFGVSLRVEDEGGKSGFTQLRQPVSITKMYEAEGPLEPLAADSEWLQIQAGRTLPVAWRLTKDGLPVDDPSSFSGVTSAAIDCSTSSASGEQVAGESPGASQLTYRQDGKWLYNWTTSKSWAGGCRLMTVSFSDGSTMTAKLRFK